MAWALRREHGSPPPSEIRADNTRGLRNQSPEAKEDFACNISMSAVRWAAIEAVARYHGGAPIAPAFARIAKRRGVMIARVAAARKLLSLIYFGLRDGEIRCLAREAG